VSASPLDSHCGGFLITCGAVDILAGGGLIRPTARMGSKIDLSPSVLFDGDIV